MTDAELWGVLGLNPPVPFVFGRWPYQEFHVQQTAWNEWAKGVIQSLPLSPSGGLNYDRAAVYLCRLLYLLLDADTPFSFQKSTAVRDLKLAFHNGLAYCRLAPSSMFDLNATLNLCEQQWGWMRFDEEDRWHPGMQSGTGWTDIVYLTPAGKQHVPLFTPPIAAPVFSTPAAAPAINYLQAASLAPTKHAVADGGNGQAGPENEPQDVARGAEKPAPMPQDAAGGMKWQEVAERLERRRTQGELFTSQADYAKRFGCSSSTVNRAIRETPSLQPWAKPETTSPPKAQSLSQAVTDRTPQQRETGPADILERPDIDAMLSWLIDQADPAERGRINAMTDDEQRRLAELAYRQRAELGGDGFEKAGRILGRKA